jgi:hypothetical protein
MLKKNLTVCLWDVRLQSLANRPPRCSILAFEHTLVCVVQLSRSIEPRGPLN